jgi:hypothetical protein
VDHGSYVHPLFQKINKIQLANPVWSFLFKTSKMRIGVITGIFEFVLMSEKGGGSLTLGTLQSFHSERSPVPQGRSEESEITSLQIPHPRKRDSE